MREAIVLLELKHLPKDWTKEDVASYLDKCFKIITPSDSMKGNFAAIKIFEVKDE